MKKSFVFFSSVFAIIALMTGSALAGQIGEEEQFEAILNSFDPCIELKLIEPDPNDEYLQAYLQAQANWTEMTLDEDPTDHDPSSAVTFDMETGRTITIEYTTPSFGAAGTAGST